MSKGQSGDGQGDQPHGSRGFGLMLAIMSVSLSAWLGWVAVVTVLDSDPLGWSTQVRQRVSADGWNERIPKADLRRWLQAAAIRSGFADRTAKPSDSTSSNSRVVIEGARECASLSIEVEANLRSEGDGSSRPLAALMRIDVRSGGKAYGLELLSQTARQGGDLIAMFRSPDANQSDVPVFLSVIEWRPLMILDQATGIRTIGLKVDEEAISAWFATWADRAGLQLSDTQRQIVLHAIGDLLRFAIGGGHKDSTPSAATPNGSLPEPLEAASALRWPIWIHGSSTPASVIQFLIYWIACIALVEMAIRAACLCRPLVAFVAGGPQWIGLPGLGRAIADRSIVLLYQRLLAGCDETVAYDSTVVQWNSRRWMVMACEAIVPALGFVGTIYGLGEAFGSVGIISKIESIQRGSLMKVLLDLGTAFSTTFVALILSGLIMIPLHMLLCSAEDRALERARRSGQSITDRDMSATALAATDERQEDQAGFPLAWRFLLAAVACACFMAAFSYVVISAKYWKPTVIGWFTGNTGADQPTYELEETEQLLRELRIAATGGDAHAAYLVGVIYANGLRGIDESDEQAVTWYRLAAQQGFEPAQERLRSMGKTWE